LDFFWIFWKILGCFRKCWDFLENLGIFWKIWGFFGKFGDFLESLGIFCNIWGFLGIFLGIFGKFGIWATILFYTLGQRLQGSRSLKAGNKTNKTRTAGIGEGAMIILEGHFSVTRGNFYHILFKIYSFLLAYELKLKAWLQKQPIQIF
jgi:hypothetical protein